MFQIVVLGLTALINLVLGFIVYSKNRRSLTHQLFFVLMGVIVLWSTINYLSVHPVIFGQLTWVRLTLCFGALLTLALYLTFLIFPEAQLLPKRRRSFYAAIAATALVMLLTLTPAVFRTLKVTHGHAAAVPAPGIALFLLQTVILIVGCVLVVAKKYRASQGAVRQQLRLILLGVGGTFSLIILSNVLLVVFFNITALIPLGPAFTLIFSGCFSYAIIRHGLFDIRRAAARGVAYVLTIGFLGGFYALLVFGISSVLFNHQNLSGKSEIINTVLAVLLAFSFQQIKYFFDRLSNRIFYKHMYDPQQFLDQFNQVLVDHANLQVLLQKCSKILIENLKADRCTFVIDQTEHMPLRLIGARPLLTEHESHQLVVQLTHSADKVVVTDELAAADSALGTMLANKRIGVVVRLTPSVRLKSHNYGEILLGQKLNGDSYTKEDVRLLEIIANELVIAIQNALRFEEIENFNNTLQQKVTDATRQLRRTNEKLKALDETKDDFISMASHQLRTPLTSIKGYISMVLEGDAGPITDLQKQMLQQSFTSSQRMVYLIADLLNVSRLKTGKFIIDSSPVNLARVVNEEVAQLAEEAKAKQLTFDYQQPEDFPELLLDETKIRQVIMNFADNALYYTPTGGHVSIKLLDKPSSIELRIVDNGLGVPKAEQPHLFTKFYRAANARKARPDGTGLGLFMAKKVIAAQGGALIFDSIEGKGSTFGFSFSKSRLVSAQQPISK